VQAGVWGLASIAHQEFIDPLQNGFTEDNDGDWSSETTCSDKLYCSVF